MNEYIKEIDSAHFVNCDKKGATTVTVIPVSVVMNAWTVRLAKGKRLAEETNDPRFTNFVNELFYEDIQELGL